MKNLVFAIFGLVLINTVAHASQTCESGKGIQTPAGRLVSTDCFASDGKTTFQFLSIDGKKFLEDNRLYGDLAIDKSRVHWVYAGPIDPLTACASKFYLVDLSTHPTTVLAFGVKTACNEFEWASWGDKRSVIALKHNVKFVYENGKLVPPRVGTKLFNSIEPPHSSVGGGMTADSAVPFVESVPRPDTP